MEIVRLLCTRRWVALSVLAVSLAVACTLLGEWQYGRSYRPVDGYSTEPAAVSLDSLDSATHPLTASLTDRQVLMSGRYDAGQQRLIAGHTVGGAPALWVITPLRLADGSAIEVVRGWVAGADTALEAPSVSAVQVTGRIQPLQHAPSTADAVSPPGYAAAIDAALLHQLPYGARDGYIVRTAQAPPDPLSLQPVPSQAPRAPQGAKQLYLLSAVYSIQWWLFAVLFVVCWLRLFSAELTAHRAGRGAGGIQTQIAVTAPSAAPQ